jgi:hypothetical protein
VAILSELIDYRRIGLMLFVVASVGRLSVEYLHTAYPLIANSVQGGVGFCYGVSIVFLLHSIWLARRRRSLSCTRS